MTGGPQDALELRAKPSLNVLAAFQQHFAGLAVHVRCFSV